MIEMIDDELVFSFPDVHPRARLSVGFQRTLRIPDDGESYPLPPGLGEFPLRHVDDFAGKVPAKWAERGGAMLPMYQSEAMWLSFGASDWGGRRTYPMAIKIATGKINAVSGDTWSNGLHREPRQDYMVAPEQPWLDGYCVEKGFIRQFVAMALGEGYTAEEQLTKEAEHGGVQIVAYPMKAEVFERRFPEILEQFELCCDMAMPEPVGMSMGLAPGGRMRQEIYEDPFDLDDWDTEHGSRCFVHIVNSLAWRHVTGSEAPHVPPTAKEYTNADLPWFEYYDEKAHALGGAKPLEQMKSVATLGKEKGRAPLPENTSVTPEKVLQLRAGMSKEQVREGQW